MPSRVVQRTSLLTAVLVVTVAALWVVVEADEPKLRAVAAPNSSVPVTSTAAPVVAGEWQAIAPSPIPARGWGVTAVWTGREMIVLGGMNIVRADADHPMVGVTYSDGSRPIPIGEARFDEPAAYDPASDTGRRLTPWPTRLDFIDSVTWTGSELVVVGSPANLTEGSRALTMLVYSPSVRRLA